MKPIDPSRRVVLTCLVFTLALATGADAAECPGWRASGWQRSADAFKNVLAAHDAWVKSDGKSGCQVKMSKADLRDANLSGANLSRAHMPGVNLTDATFTPMSVEGIQNMENVTGLSTLR